MRCWTWTSITSVASRCKQSPHKEDGDQLEDAEGDELEKPVKVKNRLAPFGPLDGGVCESDRHGGASLCANEPCFLVICESDRDELQRMKLFSRY